ncbi:MAG: AAA family ATPase [Bacillaceae bacterium]|nr:AAA family ATPase [Bacillaceae bacterium]
MEIKWLGLTDNTRSVSRVDIAVKKTENTLTWYTREDALRRELENVEHAVVFLKAATSYDIYQLCREFSLFYPLVCTVLLVPEDELDLKKAMRVGAVDVIRLSSREEEIVDAIKEAENAVKLKSTQVNHAREEEKKEYARVITITSTKGGVGKSTIAANLATAFARKLLKVAVLDLDLQFGDMAILFDVKPRRTIYDWVNEEYNDAKIGVERVMIKHESGVHIFPSPLRPEFAEFINGQHVDTLIHQLKETYDVVLVDTSPALVETGLVAMENSQDILLVTTKELPTLKNSKLQIETLESLGLKDNIHLLLNRDSRVKGLNMHMCEEILGTKVYEKIPEDEKVVLPSVNQGKPFVLSSPRAPVSKSIYSLADKLNPRPKPREKNKKSSIFKKIIRNGRRVSCLF